MGLTSAMYTGLSGLNANQVRIDTIGNNIANVNTTAFKGSRTLFQTQFFETLSAGTPPGPTTGGVNPLQIGHGVLAGTTQRLFGSGPLETTGLTSDLALRGDGFFVLRTGQEMQRFTRDGAFYLNPANQLVTQDGYHVQGYGVDANYNIIPSRLGDITIPLGTTTVARATERVALEGDLSAAGTVATRSSESHTQGLVAADGSPATAATLLSDLRSAGNAGVPLFAGTARITVGNVTRGGRTLPAQTFVIGTDGTTLGDFGRWMQDRLGIVDIPGIPGDPGVFIENGNLVVRSNAGIENDIRLRSDSISSTNGGVPLPFQFAQTADADGSAVYTGFTVYDSLGTPVSVNATFVLEEKTNQGPLWRFFIEAPTANGGLRSVGTGTVAFDNYGNVRAVEGNQLTLSRDNSGAATPMSFALDLGSIYGLSTATSGVILSEQDGYPPGTLNGYAIDKEGVIKGTFSNGLSRTLGQIAVATFANPEGLIGEQENLFTAGPNAGPVTITTAGQFGTGTIQSGALEMSNVDLGNEFIGLVGASTGFQASSRVISVSSDLLNQLLLLIR